jgi:hypothetical protein
LDKITVPAEKEAATKAFIWLLFESLYGQENVRGMLQDMIQSRWMPLSYIFDPLPSTQQEECTFSSTYTSEQFAVRLKSDIDFTVARLNECQGLGMKILYRREII